MTKIQSSNNDMWSSQHFKNDMKIPQIKYKYKKMLKASVFFFTIALDKYEK